MGWNIAIRSRQRFAPFAGEVLFRGRTASGAGQYTRPTSPWRFFPDLAAARWFEITGISAADPLRMAAAGRELVSFTS